MIHLTRLNHAPILLNSDLIEYVEKTPDTVITLTTGQKIIVLESPDEIVDLVVQFRRLVSTGPHIENGERWPRNPIVQADPNADWILARPAVCSWGSEAFWAVCCSRAARFRM